MLTTQADFPGKFRHLFTPNRYKVYYGGRGGAKSWAFARALVIQGAQRPLRILCTRELQSSITESVHKLLSDQITSLNLTSFYTIQNHSIFAANGTEFIFEGLRLNTDKIKSMEGVDICWVEEADKVSEASWAILIPTIRKSGSEIWVSFNPNLKHDATYQRFVLHPPEGAFVIKVGWQDNPWFPDELRAEMEHLKAVDYESYLHTWEGELRNFADGAIYGKQMREVRESGRICKVPIIPTVEVNTFWDLGKGDSTAIWFHQRVGLENRFIDFHQNRLVDIDYYVKYIKSKDYNYGVHYMPHDVDHEILGLGNKTRREMFEEGGVKPIQVVDRVTNIEEGIEMLRKALASCWFDKEKCEEGLEALQNYRYVYNDLRADYMPLPLHDWASHPADALRQFAQGYRPERGWVGFKKQEIDPLKFHRKSTTKPPAQWVV